MTEVIELLVWSLLAIVSILTYRRIGKLLKVTEPLKVLQEEGQKTKDFIAFDPQAPIVLADVQDDLKTGAPAAQSVEPSEKFVDDVLESAREVTREEAKAKRATKKAKAPIRIEKEEKEHVEEVDETGEPVPDVLIESEPDPKMSNLNG